MGICASAVDDTTKAIDQANKEVRNKDNQTKKLLLLGAGGSGKSTIFKQLKSIHGPGISEQERRSYKSIVIGNVIDFMRVLVQKSNELVNLPNLEKCRISDESQPFANIILEQEENFYPKRLDVEVAEAIERLWADPGIRATFDERSRFQMQDSAEYFFNNRIPAIRKQGYCPTEQDVLRARVRTTGIIEQEFKVKEHTFRVFDVGGQRNERKKWIHCFENVTGVIFVAALSAYDQMLLEDEGTNRMKEALDLFAQLNDNTGAHGSGNNQKENKKKWQEMGRWFVETAMILFMNKSDLFETKVERKPLNACPYFKDYRYPMFVKKKEKRGKSDDSKQMSRFDDGVEYIKHQFMLRNTSQTFTGHPKNIYVHVTNATDSGIIKKVFNDVQHILISQSLGEAGIM